METLCQIKCELSQMVFEKYQSMAYSLNACGPNYVKSKSQELEMLIILNESGAKCTKKDPKMTKVRFLQTEEVQPIVIHNHYEYATGGLANFSYNQAEEALEWRIYHGMGFMPSVTILDPEGFRMDASVQYLGLNEVSIKFNIPSKGTALLS